MGQMKMLKIFNSSDIDFLVSLFGDHNIVDFALPNIVGIRYDYEQNKLNYVMEKIPFSKFQQFIVTPKNVVDIISNIANKGFKPFLKLDIDLPEEEQSQLQRDIKNLRKDNCKANKKALFERLLYLDLEYDAVPESIGFYHENTRVVIRTNGIVFSNEESIQITGQILEV